jgi:hypothetical protein
MKIFMNITIIIKQIKLIRIILGFSPPKFLGTYLQLTKKLNLIKLGNIQMCSKVCQINLVNSDSRLHKLKY